MGKRTLIALALVAGLSFMIPLARANKAAQKAGKSPAAAMGAEVGAWTQDYDAALALAAEKDLPILLNFTGSDWCPWCVLMEEKVFTTETWGAWAKEHVVQVFIDFPRDKTRVPMPYVVRNRKLQKQYDVEGYPTYIVLAADGKTVLGRFGASRTARPEKVIADIEAMLEAK
ncbi:MAG: thioredoxin family protein [Kiritimatiellia bacterium]|jgi:thiol:disulfide interchange protein